MESGNHPYQKVQEDVNHVGYMESGEAPPYSATQSPLVTITQAPQAASAWPASAPIPNFHPPVGPQSTELTCPQCRSRIKTKVRHRSTTKTHCICLLLAWTGCCCCLPYCMDSCRNANHFCPLCGAFIGTYES